MTRLLVVSDTHGKANLRSIAALAQGCDMVVHLGDGFKDGQVLSLLQPAPVIQVLGNSDLPLEVVPEKLIELDGWSIYLTHGHLQGVKHGYEQLVGIAENQGCQLALFGHIHRRVYEDHDGVKLFCPGSAAYNYDGTPPGVGLIEFHAGEIRPAWLPLD